jgi:O-antigen/teichoic acid export membrane protein
MRLRLPRIGGRLLRDGAIYVIGAMLQRGASILLLPFVTRVLSVSEFGLAATGTAVATIVSLTLSLGLTNTVARFFFDDRDAQRVGWSALLLVQIVLGGLATGVVYLTGPQWSGLFGDVGWGSALQTAVVFGYVMGLHLTILGVVRAAQRPKTFVAATLVQTVGGGVLGIALAGPYQAAGYLGGLTIGTAASALIALAVVFRPPRWSRALIRSGLALSLPFVVHGLASWGLDVSDRILVEAKLGLAAVGRYQVAYSIAAVLPFLMGALQSAWVPVYLGNLSQRERRELPPAVILPLVLLSSVAAALLVLAAPYVLDVAVPASFGNTELVIGLVAASTAFRALYFTIIVVQLDAKDSRSIAVASFTGALLNVALNLVLLPTIGLPGAGLATAIAFAVQVAIVLVDAQRKIGLPLHVVRVLLVASACGGVLVPMAIIPTSLAGAALRVVIAVAVLAGAAVAVRRVTGAVRRVRAVADSPEGDQVPAMVAEPAPG